MVRVRQRLQRPRVVYVLLAVTILVYILQELTQAGIAREPFLALGRLLMGDEMLGSLIAQTGIRDLPLLLGAKVSPLIVMGQYWRLITPVVLHASLAHIGFNMYALYAIGPVLERYYGSWRFLALYMLSALGGNVLSFYMTPGLSVGASTAIFGLVAAQGVFIYQNRRLFGAQARAMLNNVLFIVGINLLLGLTGGIDNWGHLGGLLAGLAFAWFAGPLLGVDMNQPTPELADQRSQALAWIAALAVAFVLAALALLRINTGGG
jgi:rhomboid protease GluP